MAGRTTKPYKNTFSGSIGAGMGSLISPNGRKYYILEHKVSSKYHRAGESQEIIVDNIELGRDSHCQVRFDESFTTVSRHHAAIVREGDMWKLVQISKTNSTLLNGHPVKTEWYLQNGDEIQLSVNGPKLGFIIPTGKKSTVASIGLTRRLSLFRQQALRPYKTAITVLSCVLVLAVGGLCAWNYMLREDLEVQGQVLEKQILANITNKHVADSLANELVQSNNKLKGQEENMRKLRDETARAWKAAEEARKEIKNINENINTTNAPADISSCYPYVYFVNVYTYLEGTIIASSAGTGFLLKDGRFVTARHVLVNWETWVDPQYLKGTDDNRFKYDVINLARNNGGDLKYKMLAFSQAGDLIEFEYTPDSYPFKCGQYNLHDDCLQNDDGTVSKVRYTNEIDYRDYAYIRVNNSSGLDFDVSYSSSLPAKTHLDILGFPQGVGTENIKQDIKTLTPIYSESSVAREGLDTDGCILLSNNEVDHGNSGGPVLVYKDGKYKVVGILSGANRLGSKTNKDDNSGAWKTRVVPLSAMR